MTTIKLLAGLQKIAGEPNLDLPLNGIRVVRELTAAVARLYPAVGAEIVDETGTLTGKVHILVNGRNIEWLQGMDTPINEGDTVVLMPPIAGG